MFNFIKTKEDRIIFSVIVGVIVFCIFMLFIGIKGEITYDSYKSELNKVSDKQDFYVFLKNIRNNNYFEKEKEYVKDFELCPKAFNLKMNPEKLIKKGDLDCSDYYSNKIIEINKNIQILKELGDWDYE